jgi:hypothetical protein
VYQPPGQPKWVPASHRARKPQSGKTVLALARDPEQAEKLAEALKKAANRKEFYKKNRRILGFAVGSQEPTATPASAKQEKPPQSIIPLNMNEPQAKDILSQLAIGNRQALDTLGIDQASEPGIQAHEWGLGQQGSSFVLVSGAEGEIDWSEVKGYTAIAHTHPIKQVDNVAIADALNAGTLLQALNDWADQSSQTPAEARSLDEMPGNLWYLFPSNSDINAGYLTGPAFPQRVYTPFRYGPGGWISTTEGPEIVVEYGPCRAQLNQDWAATANANRALGAEIVEALCIRYYLAPLTFLTVDGSFVIHQGILRCSSASTGSGSSYSGSGAWYFSRSYQVENAFTRGAALEAIKRAFGTN